MHNTDSIHLHYIQAIISTSSAWVWSRSSLGTTVRVDGQCRAPAAACGHRDRDPGDRRSRSPSQSKTLQVRSTCRESSFSRRVGIIPQRHWEEKNLNLPKLKAALTVPAGDRRRSPAGGRTVQRRPGGSGRPSGKTWSFMFKGQQPEITGCKQWQPWLGQHSCLQWPVGAVRAGKNWPAGLHLSKFE
jgi:hypothetical protein